MPYRFTPRPGIAVYCRPSLVLPEVDFLGVTLLHPSGDEDACNVPLSAAAEAKAGLGSLPHPGLPL